MACRIFSDQGSNPCPLHWKCRVLTTAPPGQSHALLLYPFHGSDNSSFPFNTPQDSSPHLKNPKPSHNKQTGKIFLISFFYSPEFADPGLTFRVKQPCCIISNPFRSFPNISMKFSHKSPSLLTKCCAVADFARYVLM